MGRGEGAGAQIPLNVQFRPQVAPRPFQSARGPSFLCEKGAPAQLPVRQDAARVTTKVHAENTHNNVLGAVYTGFVSPQVLL